MTGALVVLAWGAINLVLWIVYWAVFEPDREPVAIYASAILIVLLTAALAAWRTRREAVPSDRQAVATSDTSHAAALFGIAGALGALSTELGPWMAYGAILAALFAVGGLTRELRAQREQRDAARERHPHVSDRVTR